MSKTNNSFKLNQVCCNNCGSSIEYVRTVEKHLCKGLAMDEPDIIIYEEYYEPVCTNCAEMTEVITKAEFANRVNKLFLKIYDDVEIDSDLIEHFYEIEKTLLN